MSWEEVLFSDIYDEPSRNGVYKSQEFHGAGVKIVNMGELFAYDYVHGQDMKRVLLTGTELEKSQLLRGDLLFGRRSLVESGAGKSSLVTDITEPTVFESSIIRVRLDQTRVNPRFYYYWFRSPSGRGRVRAIVTGTNVKGIRGSELMKLKVPFPPRAEQERIASILSAYDDLIENNRRRIQLLEESARLLYKEWFVYLRFPGHEHVKVVDGVPEGWERKALSEICDDVRDSITPDKIEAETPYIGLEHIPRRSITLGEWGKAGDVTSNKFKYQEGDILFGKIRPYFHKVGVTLTDGIASSDAIVIRPRAKDHLPLTLMVASSDEFVAVTSQAVREGSKMPRADWKFMGRYNVKIPSHPILEQFNEAINDILKQLKVLTFQNQKLTQARDLLLPRLMNGEIEV